MNDVAPASLPAPDGTPIVLNYDANGHISSASNVSKPGVTRSVTFAPWPAQNIIKYEEAGLSPYTMIVGADATQFWFSSGNGVKSVDIVATPTLPPVTAEPTMKVVTKIAQGAAATSTTGSSIAKEYVTSVMHQHFAEYGVCTSLFQQVVTLRSKDHNAYLLNMVQRESSLTTQRAHRPEDRKAAQTPTPAPAGTPTPGFLDALQESLGEWTAGITIGEAVLWGLGAAVGGVIAVGAGSVPMAAIGLTTVVVDAFWGGLLGGMNASLLAQAWTTVMNSPPGTFTFPGPMANFAPGYVNTSPPPDDNDPSDDPDTPPITGNVPEPPTGDGGGEIDHPLPIEGTVSGDDDRPKLTDE